MVILLKMLMLGNLLMSNKATFLSDYMNGLALADDIDDYIDLWRDKYADADSAHIPTLREFLGFTKDEYDLWIHDSDCLGIIVYSRTCNVSIGEALNITGSLSMAARADNDKLTALVNWLKEKYANSPN